MLEILLADRKPLTFRTIAGTGGVSISCLRFFSLIVRPQRIEVNKDYSRFNLMLEILLADRDISYHNRPYLR